jgi:pyruvate dehydrogenase E1 component alpha subunit
MSVDRAAVGTDRDRHLYSEMVRIRRFEERCVELYSRELIRGFMHLAIGQEAVAVGVAGALEPSDALVSTYREHAHALARGIPAEAILAEMMGRREGVSGGRGGSMHLFDARTRFYGGNAIVAGGLPLAAGLALADSMQERPGVTVCDFGEGAAAEGEFHETLNLAALWQLPVLFCCENNHYAMGTALDVEHAQTDLVRRAASYGMSARRVDGMDMAAVDEAARDAVARVRAGEPLFLEFETYRFRAHSMYDPERYRTKEEVATWRDRDPLVTWGERLEAEGALSPDERDELEAQVASWLDAAVARAEAGSLEPVEDLTRFVHHEEGSWT